MGADDTKLSPTVEQLFADLNQVYSDIAKLTDPYDKKVAKLTERQALLHRHFGRIVDQ